MSSAPAQPPAAPPPPPARPPGASRYGWLVGVLVLVILTYIAINHLRTEGPGARGLRTGIQLPPFAAPLVLSSLDGDANVARRAGSGEAGEVPACSIRRPDVLNSCELAEGGPVALGFLALRGADCTGSFDVLQELHERHPELQVAGVVIRGDRDDARKLVRERGWEFPIAYDRDGIIANIYGVAVCPEVVLTDGRGIVRETVLGDGPALQEEVRELLDRHRRRPGSGAGA